MNNNNNLKKKPLNWNLFPTRELLMRNVLDFQMCGRHSVLHVVRNESLQ